MPQAILVAEDDASLRDVIAWSLRAEGYRVVTAADGIEALRILAAGLAGLAVLDVRMPKMSGLEVIERMRRSPNLRRIPVVVQTAFPDEAPAALAILPKPFSAARLLEVVGAILGSGRSAGVLFRLADGTGPTSGRDRDNDDAS